MQVKCSNPATKSVTLAKFDGLRVNFSPTGLATVSEDVGAHLIRFFPAITTKTKGVSKSTAKRRLVVEDKVAEEAVKLTTEVNETEVATTVATEEVGE